MALNIGSRIGPYLVSAIAGEGAMGRVYRAVDTTLERTCALKVLQPYLVASDEARKRFLREAQAAARLLHPNIATVFGVMEREHQAVIASEWVEGRTLEGHAFLTPASWPRGLVILAQLSAAVDAAHRAGVQHRDLKPSNVMLSDSGQVKLCDFGLARFDGGTVASSELAGTPDRMAPEIWQGLECGRAADIFALGTIAYEMFTGHAPFWGNSAPAVGFKIVNEPHDPPTKWNDDLPPDADAAIGWALAKDPSDRPASALVYFERICTALGVVVPPGFWYGTPVITTRTKGEGEDGPDARDHAGSTKPISITVETADALEISADVLVLKYAQALYGVDEAVAVRLFGEVEYSSAVRVSAQDHCLVESRGAIGSRSVLFVGSRDLYDFDYSDIFAIPRRALAILKNSSPGCKTIAMTLHGAGVGLGESESLRAELQGITESLRRGEYPPALESIVFVEINRRRAELMQIMLQCSVPDGHIRAKVADSPDSVISRSEPSALVRPRLFATLPPLQSMNDLYHFGIDRPASSSGFLCERADTSYPKSATLEWAKRRISDSSLFLADVTGNDPIVYLHIGYAFDQGRRTLLTIPEGMHPRMDLGGVPHLIYKKPEDLEAQFLSRLDELHRQLADS